MAKRKNKTISCICGTKAKKSGPLSSTAKQCVCSINDKRLGFPITVHITRDRDEPKRQRRGK